MFWFEKLKNIFNYQPWNYLLLLFYIRFKVLNSWLSFVLSNCEVVTFPLVEFLLYHRNELIYSWQYLRMECVY